MKLLFGLTENQMQEVYREVERSYYEEDVICAINDWKEDGKEYNFTEAEIAKASEYAQENVQESVLYSDYAREALREVLDNRERKC